MTYSSDYISDEDLNIEIDNSLLQNIPSQEEVNSFIDYLEDLEQSIKDCRDCIYYSTEENYCAVHPDLIDKADECPDYQNEQS